MLTERAADSSQLLSNFLLSRSGRLSLDELSRHPGPLRELRFRGARAAELMAGVDELADLWRTYGPVALTRALDRV